MFKFISFLLDKMGNWFGIVFKMALPLVVMFRPLKTFVFTFVLIGTFAGGNSYLSTDLGVVAFGILYAVFAIIVIFLPKVASVVEFILIGNYFAFLIFLNTAIPQNEMLAELAQVLPAYSRALPMVIVFLAGKIMFFFLLRANDEEYKKRKNRKNQLILRP